MSILFGVEGENGILQKRFGKYGTRTGARAFLKDPCSNDEMLACLEDVYNQIAENYRNGTDSLSPKNWRFTLEPEIAERNFSKEKRLEKNIAKTVGCQRCWANQVPVASGLVSHDRDTKRSIDLVHLLGNETYEFIELKIASNNPVYAAIEVLVYGVLYVFFRTGGPEKRRIAAKVAHDDTLLTTSKIRLRVIAPIKYYEAYDKKQLLDLEKLFSDNLNFWVKNKVNGLRMWFSFEEFPYDPKDLVNSFFGGRFRLGYYEELRSDEAGCSPRG